MVNPTGHHLARFHQQVPPVGAAVHLNLNFHPQYLKIILRLKVILCIVDGWRLWFARRRFWLPWLARLARLLPRLLCRRLFPFRRLWLPSAFGDQNQGKEEEKQEGESHRELDEIN